MANYEIPNWAMERFLEIENYMLHSMTMLAETTEMQRLYSGSFIYIFYNTIMLINNYV